VGARVGAGGRGAGGGLASLSGPPAGLCSYYDSESPQPGRRRRPLCHGCDASPSLCATVAVSPTPQNRPDPGISPGGRGLGPAAAAPWPTGPAPAAIVGNAAARHATSTSVNPPHWRRLRETLEISPVIRFLATKLHGWSQVAQGSPAHGYGMMDTAMVLAGPTTCRQTAFSARSAAITARQQK
jgi:hypothetical protein